MDNIEKLQRSVENPHRFYEMLGESVKMNKGKVDQVATDTKKAADYIECQKLMDTILDDNNSRRPLSVRLKELIKIIEEISG